VGLKRLPKKLLTTKRNAQETLLSSVLQNEGKSWSGFYRFVNRRKGNRVNIPTIKDCNGGLITDPVYKANNLNNYYASVVGCERDIPDINSTHSDKPFTTKISIINPLNPELIPICYLLLLLAHHFLHVSRRRVKSLTLRLLMSYIYIYIYGAPILDVSRSHTTTHHSR